MIQNNSKKRKRLNNNNISKNNLTIVTHNCGGQSLAINGNKQYLCSERGYFSQDNYGKYNIENPDLTNKKSPISLSLPADLWCLQEHVYNGEKGIAIYDRNKSVIFSKSREIYSIPFRILYKSKNYSLLIINLHGKIISPSSSFNQIEKAIEILEKVVILSKETNVIILGDFNFEIMNPAFLKDCLWSMQDYSIRGKYSEKQKLINNNIENFMNRLLDVVKNIKKNYDVYPNKKGDFTNAWTIGNPKHNKDFFADKSNYLPSVDFCLTSKNLIGLQDINYTIHTQFLATHKKKKFTYMIDDFDHAPITFNFTFKKGVEIIQS